ncbi:hypothetical protein OU994_06720 [Pseudoduganella sp. SL102]|uniref:hypothetical protein n=1 Tax=Pseudoduganella sp. SL102 TaxID=2995154 RepID=UPI00248CCE8B|nr:hypothetical protein [Pseudoduganella sp. SL102]WBS03976.1 hypothetical protein OU994_06720 [Pseudoduganella sp. SL102]
MKRFAIMPALAALASVTLMSACANIYVLRPTENKVSISTSASTDPYKAQVVGIQWLNPLQRRDYSTEWQLLWTLGLSKPNKDDDLVRTDPASFSTLQAIGSIVSGVNGEETFPGFHRKYFESLIVPFHDNYFSYSTYFYNAHNVKEKDTWRELAGIHVEYALPSEKLDPLEARSFAVNFIRRTFAIGNPNFPTAWTRDAVPDVHVTTGGENIGFKSLSAALDYLQTHPSETAWAMNWDAPNFPPKDDQLNENMVLLVLAGPDYKTEREPLAWIGYPATHNAADFEKKSDLPPRVMQAWKATLAQAVQNAGKEPIDIGYVIHDAHNTHADSGERIANLAHISTKEIAEFDFVKQSFNTSALLGDMGAGSALTNVALGIAYANHIGKNVLVAGTTDLENPAAVVIVPPAKVRPIDHDKPWFRARSENNAYLMWWGIRQDTEFHMQGYSK